jgi:hypothetical protein
MYSYPIETLRSAAMQNFIVEWASPNFHHPEYWPFLLIVIGTFAVLIWSRRPVRPRDVLLLAVSLYAGLGSIRMMPLFVLVAIPVVCQRVGGLPARPSQPARPKRGAPLLNGTIVLAIAVFAGVHTVHVIQGQPQAEMQHFPARAVALLQTHPPSAPIFNHYDWGGYLIWKLYPATRVFIDGRADLYGTKLQGAKLQGANVLDQFADTYQFKGAVQSTLQQWKIRMVLVPAGSSLATGLRSSPGWTVAYEDSQAVLLTAPSLTLQAATSR